MEIINYTREELIADIFNHTGNEGYNPATEEHDLLIYKKSELRKMNNENLEEVFREMTTWGSEVKLIIE